MNVRPSHLIAATLFLTGCAQQPAADAPPPLAGAAIGGPFTLTDQTGRQVSDRAFAGKYRIMYFGYTFCPDVCPTDLQVIGTGLKAFERTSPTRAAKVVPIFVSVDPARDTPAVLKSYVAAFHPRLVGLTGSKPALDALTKAYGVYYKLGPPQPGGGYLVDHSRQTYLMGPKGEPIALLSGEGPPQKLADELTQWVK